MQTILLSHEDVGEIADRLYEDSIRAKRMFGKYKQALVKKKLPRLVRLDKIQNPNSHQGSHDSSLHHRINIGTV
jgi:hypothetical protein